MLLMHTIGFIAIAQDKDYSKDVIRKVNDLKNEVEYTSPSLLYGTSVYIKKIIVPDEPIVAGLVFQVMGIVTNYNAKGIFIKFEDGEILRYPNEPLNCSYISSMDRALFLGALILDDELFEKFSKKKIMEISLDDNKGTLSKRMSERLPSYVRYVYPLSK